MTTEQLLVEHAAMNDALAMIARGRRDCGRPIGGETARQLARITLAALGRSWDLQTVAASLPVDKEAARMEGPGVSEG